MRRYGWKEIADKYKDKHIAIIGNGPSVARSDGQGGVTWAKDFRGYPHPIWAVNGGWLRHPGQCQLGFVMDDPTLRKYQDISPWNKEYHNKLKKVEIPIFATRRIRSFPSFIEFPLQEVVEKFNDVYFGETVHYMIAFALMIGVKEIDLFGCDYKGARTKLQHERAGTEYWLGIAKGAGIKVNLDLQETTLCTYVPKEEYAEVAVNDFYGYVKEYFPLMTEKEKNATT